MSLNITEKNGIFEVSGNLSAANAHQVRKYFEIMVKMNGNLKICLSKLDSMDIASVFELKTLLTNAAHQGKILTVLGAGNKKIHGAFLRSGCDLFNYNYFKMSA